MQIGQVIRTYRKKKNMTQEEMAVRLELAQAKEDIEETLVCAEKMLASVGQVGGYGNARLYE